MKLQAAMKKSPYLPPWLARAWWAVCVSSPGLLQPSTARWAVLEAAGLAWGYQQSRLHLRPGWTPLQEPPLGWQTAQPPGTPGRVHVSALSEGASHPGLGSPNDLIVTWLPLFKLLITLFLAVSTCKFRETKFSP